MYLYHLTLSRASGIQSAIYGNFSGPKAQEIVVSRGKLLELLRPDDNGKVQTIVSTDVFGCIRSLAPFRLTGAPRDYIIVGSDSGRIVILEYSKEKNSFVKVHQETFGRSGCRRVVPGQYLACDPKGRACMIGAVEKQKFVYVLNRDNQANLTISSPLEAHKSHTICYHLVGMDCGFDNPMFAAIELDYQDADQDTTGEAVADIQKHLTFYELDLGLNTVTRKWSEPIGDNSANHLIAVPGGGDGPGGVLVCAENFVIYKNQDQEADVRAVIPRRTSLDPERNVLIVASAMHKQKTVFFFLVQSEYGDLYKITLLYTEDTVTELRIKYFDSIPVCTSLCLLRTGFLFAASESGNHALYQFQGLGDDTDDVESSSASLVETEEGFAPVFFDPRPLRNLLLIDEPESMAPIVDMRVENVLNEEIPQIYALCGRGPRSTLRVLRPGLAVTELAVSPLPGQPTAVWTIKRATHDEFDAYIIVSFTNATLVLSIGETVEEVNDSGFLGTTPTLTVQLLADNSMLQVHPQGIRHIRTDRRIQEWRAPGRRTIVRAATNQSQVIIALNGGELIYFEMDQVNNLTEVGKKDMSGDIACLDIAPVSEGLQRTRWLAVGSYDSTVRVLSLNPDDCMTVHAVQQVKGTPESLLLIESSGYGADGTREGGGAGALFLHAGLQNGVLMRSEIDRVTGKLSDARQRFLGTRAVKLFSTQVRGQRSMLALSSRPWLGYSDQGRYTLVPMSYEALDYASSFASDQCPEGFVAVAQSTLRVITLERLGETFNQVVTRLRYTPKRAVLHPQHKVFVIAEADHAAIPLAQRQDLEQPSAMAVDGQPATDPPAIELNEERAALEDQMGAPKGATGQWASCLRVLDPSTLSTHCVLELDNNEAAFSMCLAQFSNRADAGWMLVVGTASGMRWYPRENEGGFLRVYRFTENGRRIELVHKTQVDGVPAAVCAFQGKLLAGIGTSVKLYEFGKKRLLRKCEYRKIPNFVKTIHAAGNRIFVADMQESFHYMKYEASDNQLYTYADDGVPRFITAALNLDYDTMCGADKFGNIFIARLPTDVSTAVEEDPTGGKYTSQIGLLNGAPNKLESVIQFHVGDIVTSLQRATFQPGGQEMIVYATIMGAIGVLLPFTSRQDVDFFQHLEMHLRQEHPPLCGRDHLAFRSAYFPVKDVIDGDLCEQYSTLPHAKQQQIATELDRSPGQVLKKLEDIRNKIL